MATPKGETIKRAAIPAACWGFILVVMLALWSLPPVSGELRDPDDYMRMTRVFDLLDGSGAPSYSAPRLGPQGSEIGWSRLADAPLAAVQRGLEIFMDRIPAAMWTATVVPALALLALVFAAFWYAGPLAPGQRGRAIFIFFALLCSWGILRQFFPGRVDHHMWQILLTVFAFGALVRTYFAPERLRYPVMAGLAFGAGLAIGADILPGLTFGTAMLGLFWLARGRDYERAGFAYGGGVSGMALACHLLLSDQGRFFVPSCDSLSVAWLGLAAAILLFWALAHSLPPEFKAGWKGRFFTGLAVAVPLLAALYLFFPACFHDPYMIGDPLVREIWLSAVREARSLPALYDASPNAALFFIVPVFLALAGALWALAEKRDCVLWSGLALAVAGGLALNFYQVRTIDYAQAVALGPLVFLLASAGERLAVFAGGFTLSRRQRLAAAAAFFALCLAFTVFAALNKQDHPQAESGAQRACDIRAAAKALDQLPGSLMIAAYIDEGSALLFYTSHKVLAAPYHRNEAGIRAAYEIMTAPDATAARRAFGQSGGEVLLLCGRRENFWLRHNAPPGGFAAQLLAGEIPPWLAPVGMAEENGGYLILKKVN